MMQRAIKVAALCVGLALATGPAAEAATGTFNVVSSVVVSSVCTYNGTPTLNFASYDPIVANASTALTATGALSITCPDTLAYTVTANLGSNSGHASGSCATTTCSRAMVSGTNYLSYDIYTSSGNTTVWNTTNSIAGTGNGLAQTVNVYGYIPPAQVAAAGAYADTVTVTVTF